MGMEASATDYTADAGKKYLLRAGGLDVHDEVSHEQTYPQKSQEGEHSQEG